MVAVFPATGSGINQNIKDEITKGLQEGILKSEQYKLVNQNIEKALSVIKYQQSGAVADNYLIQFGKTLRADYVVYAIVSKHNNSDYRISYKMIDISSEEVPEIELEDVYNGSTGIFDAVENISKKLFSNGGDYEDNNYQPPTIGENIIFTVKGVTFEMIFVQGGIFVMGCTSEQSDCYDSEKPSHSVTLSDFYIGKFQVTQKLWQVVMGTNIREQRTLAKTSWSLYGEGDDFPMYLINYNECVEFCSKLNKLLSEQLPKGYKFRLPTEAQWEYAARGGQKTKGYKFSGSNNLNEVAWYTNNSGGKAYKVGLKNKNELGIYDMSGNIYEWCLDWYGANYYSNNNFTNPKGPEFGAKRVLRGGSKGSRTQDCRVCNRANSTPDTRGDNGFRIALTNNY